MNSDSGNPSCLCQKANKNIRIKSKTNRDLSGSEAPQNTSRPVPDQIDPERQHKELSRSRIKPGASNCKDSGKSDVESTEYRLGEGGVLQQRENWEKTFNAVPDLICLLDDKSRVVQINRAMADRLGLLPEQCIGQQCYKAVHGRESPLDNCPHSQTLKDGLSHTVEVYEEKLGGYFLVSTSPLTDKAGKIIGSVHVARDITERKKAEEARAATERQLKDSLFEKDILLKEIHHRVKNNLQIISSLLSLQCAKIKDKKTIKMLRENQNRIRSLAMIHEKLYQSGSLSSIDISQCIRDLSSHLLSVYNSADNPVKVLIAVDNISFGIETAMPCGLVINELVSNALKHAFEGNRKVMNIIEIGLRSYRGKYRLVVSDNGIGLPSGPKLRETGSFGLQLVFALAKQMGGRISIRRENGTKISITFQELKLKAPAMKP